MLSDSTHIEYVVYSVEFWTQPKSYFANMWHNIIVYILFVFFKIIYDHKKLTEVFSVLICDNITVFTRNDLKLNISFIFFFSYKNNKPKT